MLAESAVAHEDDLVEATVFLSLGSAAPGAAAVIAHADDGAGVERAECERVFEAARHRYAFKKRLFISPAESMLVVIAVYVPSLSASVATRRASASAA